MSVVDALGESGRVMRICNACRYCEGYCAVFPAMALRRTLSAPDLKYLANLCHNCRACYYACQYAPPHAFALNVPRTLSQLRFGTYRESAEPGFLASWFTRNGLAVSIITASSVVLFFILSVCFQGIIPVFSTHYGDNAFYRVIPYGFIVAAFLSLAFCVALALSMGLLRFLRESGGPHARLLSPVANWRAIRETLILKYLDGYGRGCNYPDERFSQIRRWLHHLVLYGFLLCFASTLGAAVYEHFLDRHAPYPFWSLPVMAGAIGGIALMVGTAGSLYLKGRMDKELVAPEQLGLDVTFLVLLFSTSLSGLLLLLLRETPAMGILFIIHMGVVTGLFVTMPYGKFVHAVYRYAALVRNAVEQAEEEKTGAVGSKQLAARGRKPTDVRREPISR